MMGMRAVPDADIEAGMSGNGGNYQIRLYTISDIYLMNRFILAAVAALAIGVSSPAFAQTCRVSSGVGANGCKNYIEVFEYDYVTEKPTFPGGDSELMADINHCRQYPRSAYDRGVQGRVTCSFVICSDGGISHVQVLKGVDPELNREAVRIFSEMPKWRPGRLDGKAVPVRVIRSVPFRK